MSRIAPSLQKIFGSSLTTTGNVAVFGSLAAGAPAYSSDPKTIQSLSQYLEGFTSGVVGNNSPAIQDMNSLMLAVTSQIAYFLQQGVPEWNTDNPYYIGGFATDGAGNLYVSQTNGNIGHALSDTNNWLPYGQTITGPAVCRAWVVLDGINHTGSAAAVLASFNVTGVTWNLAGSYTVNFATAMPTASYTLSGSCGSQDGNAYGGGDDSVVVGNVAGQGNAVRSTTACRFFTINPTSKALAAPGMVSVAFFG